MKRVFFDESGNTGQDLLNPADPVFTLSSCCFDQDQESKLFDIFSGFQGPELKFAKLRKSAWGQRTVLRFLDAAEVSSSTVAAFVTHKRFMIVTKYCDIVLEPSVKAAGLDFYERGWNIATANLLAMTMPVFLNPVTWDRFLAAFVRVIRDKSQQAFDDFVRFAELICNHLEHADREMLPYVEPVLLLKSEELLPLLNGADLDPLPPAYHVLADHWGKQLATRFEIVADRSKALANERDRLLEFSSQDLRPFKAGYDRRTVEFPLKVAAISVVDSRMEKQVQLADVLAGAITRVATSSATSKADTFENHLYRVCSEKRLWIGGVWPVREVDPEKLGTDQPPGVDQFNLPTYATLIAQKHPSTQIPGSDAAVV